MSRRERIDAVINDPATSPEDKEKLQLVSEARTYASAIGLEPKNTFIKYAKLDTDVLAWILLASKADSFELYTWWFPVVGTVPYKGFFDIEDAKAYSEGLLKDGYEVSVRGTAAFSTLGWFDDPILSTTLKNDAVAIVNTVLHESVHTTIWVKGKVDFNESLANFVGTVAACEFFKARLAACLAEDLICMEKNRTYYEHCLLDQARDFEFAGNISKLYAELDSLYRSQKTTPEKLAEREVVFNSYMAPLRLKFPNMKALQKINNAEIMQYKLYMNGFEDLTLFYKNNGQNINKFVTALLAKEMKIKDSKNPYSELNN